MEGSSGDDFANRERRFYRLLALSAVLVIVFSIVFALGMKDINVQGVFGVAELTRGLLFAAVGISAILVLFLLRIGNIFDVERKVDSMFKAERERLDSARKAELDAARQFRDDVKSELAGLREQWRKDLAGQDIRLSDAVRAANQALKAAQDALARADALSREPAYRTTIEELVKKVDGLVKDVSALRNADKVNSPLLKELQEKVVLLEKGQGRLNHRMDEQVEAAERRDMEAAAIRMTLDTELGNLKKREMLLLVKQKELEDLNTHLQTDSKRGRVQF
jgi:predicted  nucleic acid-binding Zn-ribbon protein